MFYVHTPTGVQTEVNYPTGVGLGLIPTHSRVTSLGHNPSIGSGLAADVWEGGGNFPFLAAASQLEILSTSVNDIAGGLGARTVIISGLDANYNTISETVTLNGTTPVTTTKNYLRVNLLSVTTAGSDESNDGDLTLRVAGAGSVQCVARAGYGFGRSCVYTVPAGFTLFIVSVFMSVLAASGANTNSATFGIFQRSSVGVRRIPPEFQVTSTVPYRHDAVLGIVLAQKTDFTMRVTNAGQAGTNVTAGMEGILVNNLALL